MEERTTQVSIYNFIYNIYNNLPHKTILFSMKSSLIRGEAFDGSSLIRGEAFDGSSLIRGEAFDGRAL